MATVEELTGIVKGLADVVKSQLTSQHEAHEANRQNIEALAKTVAELATNSTSSSSVDTLKLPQVVLHRYTGKPDEHLDRFLDQLTTLLKSSGVPPKHWTTYLKQQVQQDVRAYDSVVFAEEECKHALGEDPTNITIEQYERYFDLVKTSLVKKRGKPKDERVRELLQDYYHLQQDKAEPVSTFAHRFCEIQHELEKCIPGIHYTGTNDDIELRHAFLIKLRPDIGKALMSRDAKYSSLAEIIEAVSRFEQSLPPLPVLSPHYVDPFREDKAMLSNKCCYNCNQPGHLKKNCPAMYNPKKNQEHKPTFPTNDTRQTEVCLQWNQRATPRCLLPDSSCKFHRQHVCLVCKEKGCKQLSHKDAKVPLQSKVEEQLSSKFQAQFDSLCSKLETVLPKLTPPTPPTPQPPTPPTVSADIPPATDYPLFGMPSLVTDSVEIPDLSKKYIMWAKVKSAGIELSLPLDSCCSVSFCSLNHAQRVQQLHPDLKMTKLTKPVAINVANEDAVLQGIALQDVPITWGPGKLSVHTMLVVPKLAWHVLFGNNHLEAADAIVKHKDRIVSFTHPQMHFTIKFPQEPPVRPSGGAETHVVSLSTVIETPPKLLPGINIITVCLIVTTIGSTLVLPALSNTIAEILQSSGNQFWIQASSLFTAANVHVIPGPFNLDQIHHETNAFKTPFVNVKCCSSKFLEEPDTINIESEQKFYVNLAVYNQSKHDQILPVGVIADLTKMTDAYQADFHLAASDMASDMACEAVAHLEQVQLHQNLYRKAVKKDAKTHGTFGYSFHSFNPADAAKEMNIAFRKSNESCFSQFTNLYCANHSTLLDENRDLPPLSDLTLDSFSQEYKNLVVDAVHLHDNCNLSPTQKRELELLIRKYAHVFMLPGAPFRGVSHVEHSMDTGDAKPQYSTPYSHSPIQLQLIKQEIQKMLEQNILEPSTSPWGAPCLLVKKKTEHGLQVTPRLVWDYRKLNKVTKPDVYPLPHVQMILDQLGGKKWFTKLDLFSGFWHIPISPNDREKTAVITHVGLYQFKKLPFGLRNAPTSFQRLMMKYLTCRLMSTIYYVTVQHGTIIFFTLNVFWHGVTE